VGFEGVTRILALIGAYVASIVVAVAMLIVWDAVGGGVSHEQTWGTFAGWFYRLCLFLGILTAPAFVVLRLGMAWAGLQHPVAYAALGGLAALVTNFWFGGFFRPSLIAFGTLAGLVNLVAERIMLRAFMRSDFEARRP
jgi:hypothetical protein